MTYLPAADYFGPDSFTFIANDGSFDSNTATISISVAAVNDAPKGKVTINAGKPEVTASTLVLLKLIAVDDGGGASEMCISNT